MVLIGQLKPQESQLVEIDINGATDAIIFITSDIDMTMNEVYDVVNEIRNASSSDIDIIVGAGFNMDLQGELVVTVIATGFDKVNEEVAPSNEVNEFETKNTIQETVLNTGGSTTEIPAGQRRKREVGESIPEWLKNRFK